MRILWAPSFVNRPVSLYLFLQDGIQLWQLWLRDVLRRSRPEPWPWDKEGELSMTHPVISRHLPSLSSAARHHPGLEGRLRAEWQPSLQERQDGHRMHLQQMSGQQGEQISTSRINFLQISLRWTPRLLAKLSAQTQPSTRPWTSFTSITTTQSTTTSLPRLTRRERRRCCSSWGRQVAPGQLISECFV